MIKISIWLFCLCTMQKKAPIIIDGFSKIAYDK